MMNYEHNFEDVYVIAKSKDALLSPTIYDFKTASSIVEKLKESGNKDAEVITLLYAYSNGYQIIATTPHDDSCLLHEFDITKPSALFFGTERDGLSKEVLEQADGFLKIPMVGYTESLNISVSAAIIIQDITNRLRQSDLDWKLTDEEVWEKRLDWARKSIKDIEFIERKYWEALQNQ
jgi:tRNA G18 (ribose-2'-O)-methylase SpoU